MHITFDDYATFFYISSVPNNNAVKSPAKTDTDASLCICLQFSLVRFPENAIIGLMCFLVFYFIRNFQIEPSGYINSNSLPQYENPLVP